MPARLKAKFSTLRMLPLRELQSCFFRSLSNAPADSPEKGFDPTLLQYIQANEQLGAEQRLDIYARMYDARLLEVLQEDFPRVMSALGHERFCAVARAYLHQHLSLHPSVRHLGRRLPQFLDHAATALELPPFLADLARLEWTRQEVFDALDAEPLQLAHLQAVPAEAWPEVQFCLIPACDTVQSDWPVHEIWVAAEDSPVLSSWRPAKTLVRVWRQDFAVYHAGMDAVEQRAFDTIRAGTPFAAACATLEPLFPTAEEAAEAMGRLLLRWIEDGIIARLSGI